MARLHIYTAHINPALTQPYEATQFIEEGFSWTGFIFTVFWTLYHRLWLASIGIICVDIALYQMMKSSALSHTGYSIMDLGVHLLVGCYANDWRRAKLKRKNYILADIVSGDSLIRAEQRFFDRYFSSPAMPFPMP